MIGAGVSGMNAAAIALGMQAEVLLLDRNIDKLREADRIYQGHLQTDRLQRVRGRAGGAGRRPGHRRGAGARAKAPTLISNELVSRMRPGSVLVDIAIDQGGCFEDCRPTTHAEPTFRCTTRSSTAWPTCPARCRTPHLRADQRHPALRAEPRRPRLAGRTAGRPALALGLNTHDGELVIDAWSPRRTACPTATWPRCLASGHAFSIGRPVAAGR